MEHAEVVDRAFQGGVMARGKDKAWVNDGRMMMVQDEKGFWFVRHVWITTYDMDEGVMKYTCDYPLALAHIIRRKHKTMEEALVTLKEALQINVPRRRTRTKKGSKA